MSTKVNISPQCSLVFQCPSNDHKNWWGEASNGEVMRGRGPLKLMFSFYLVPHFSWWCIPTFWSEMSEAGVQNARSGNPYVWGKWTGDLSSIKIKFSGLPEPMPHTLADNKEDEVGIKGLSSYLDLSGCARVVLSLFSSAMISICFWSSLQVHGLEHGKLITKSVDLIFTNTIDHDWRMQDAKDENGEQICAGLKMTLVKFCSWL